MHGKREVEMREEGVGGCECGLDRAADRCVLVCLLREEERQLLEVVVVVVLIELLLLSFIVD